MKNNLLIFLLILCVAAATIAQTSKSATQPAKSDPYALTFDNFSTRTELHERIKKDSVDIPLLEAAIFHESNRIRADLKLSQFKHSFALQLMARRHSTEMSDLQFFDHVSPTPSNANLSDRLKKVGLVNVTAGENIAVLPAKEMGSGHYIVRKNDDGTEDLTDEQTGKHIDYYPYDQLAKTVVDQWMHSPAHRATMVDKRFVYLGVGVARGPYDKGQDSFYMTQNFSATINAGESKAASTLVDKAPVSPSK